VGGVAYKYIGIGIVIGIVHSILYHSYSGKPLREGHPRRRIPESVALHLCHTSYSARESHLNPYDAFTSGGGTATSELDTLLSARDTGCRAVLRAQQVKCGYHTYLFTFTLGRPINLDPTHVLAYHES
jgi:hypothetical protein